MNVRTGWLSVSQPPTALTTMIRLSSWLDRNSLYIALLAAWVAMMGSLYFSEVAGFVPCTLCWYQRILMYPLTVVLAVGLLRQDPSLPWLVLPFTVSGIGFSGYHYLLEKTDLFSSHSVCQAGVSCTTAWINWFGFITIPFLAFVGFLTILLMTVIALNAGEPDPEVDHARPWLPVLTTVVAVLIAYAVLAFLNRQAPVDVAAASGPAFELADVGAPAAQSRVTTAAAEQAAAGARLYAQSCAVCHGPDAEGVAGLGNALVGNEFVASHSDDGLAAFLIEGRSATDPVNQTGVAMPPRAGRPDLTDDDFLAIITFLRTLTAEAGQ